MSINIYDFDNTIYKGDCTIDFYLFCVRQNPLLIKYLPYQFLHFVLYVFKLESTTNFKSRFFVFLHGIDDVDKQVRLFWDGHYQKIKRWYLEKEHSKDVIISSSPDFLLRPVFQKLKAHTLIATSINSATGIINGQNCKGQEKVIRLKQIITEHVVEETYTDSLSDRPILALAKRPYIVKGNVIRPFKVMD